MRLEAVGCKPWLAASDVDGPFIQTYTFPVPCSWDERKSPRHLRDRGVDFGVAPLIFDGPTLEREDTRRDYGERRVVAVGIAQGVALTAVNADRWGFPSVL